MTLLRATAATLLLTLSEAWVATRTRAPNRFVARSADDFPSDVDPGAADFADADVADAEIVFDKDELKTSLLEIAAYTSKGESADEGAKSTARDLVAQLESLNEIENTVESSAEITGTWELIFSDTQLFRSSPFFMAGRAVCADGDEARKYDWFCDMHRAALAISNIKRVRQIVSADRVVSEFEVSVGAVPFASSVPLIPQFAKTYLGGGLPVVIEGSIVSSADIVEKEGGSWDLLMDTVEIKGSNVPLLRQLLDGGLKLNTRDLGDFLESSAASISSSGSYSNPKPKFETTYLDERLRVSRDQDGKIFVYTKVSTKDEPTDYSAVPADFGVVKLLGGVADNFIPQI